MGFVETTKDSTTCVTCGNPEKFLGVCQTCYMREWRRHKAPALPSGVTERHAFPYRVWEPAEEPYTNVAHCVSQIRVEDRWRKVALCDWRIWLTEILTFQVTPRPCRRCVTILTRLDLILEQDVIVKTA